MTTLVQDILDGLDGKRPNPLPQAEGMMPEQAFIIKKHQLLELLASPAAIVDGGPYGTLRKPIALTLPDEMTPAIRDVLAMMLWDSAGLAHAYRLVGVDVRKRTEDEQAFSIWHCLRAALEHGERWREVIAEDLQRRTKEMHK